MEKYAHILFIKFPIIKRIYRKFFGPKRYQQLFFEVEKIKPKTIMEIGVWDGEHALKMISIAKKYHEVEYFGFDLFESMDNKLFSKEVAKQPPGMNYVKKKLSKTKAKINLIRGDTTVSISKKLSSLPKMDLIYIDGGHSIQTIKSDWNNCKKLMHKDTVVIFDDYWNRDKIGCKKVVEKIDRKKYKVEILPIQDKFNKTEGVLKINFVKVVEKPT